MIHFVADERLRQIAVINFIHSHDLIDMLIEGDEARRLTLDFEINKDVTLRRFLGA